MKKDNIVTETVKKNRKYSAKEYLIPMNESFSSGGINYTPNKIMINGNLKKVFIEMVILFIPLLIIGPILKLKTEYYLIFLLAFIGTRAMIMAYNAMMKANETSAALTNYVYLNGMDNCYVMDIMEKVIRKEEKIHVNHLIKSYDPYLMYRVSRISCPKERLMIIYDMCKNYEVSVCEDLDNPITIENVKYPLQQTMDALIISNADIIDNFIKIEKEKLSIEDIFNMTDDELTFYLLMVEVSRGLQARCKYLQYRNTTCYVYNKETNSYELKELDKKIEGISILDNYKMLKDFVTDKIEIKKILIQRSYYKLENANEKTKYTNLKEVCDNLIHKSTEVRDEELRILNRYFPSDNEFYIKRKEELFNSTAEFHEKVRNIAEKLKK